MDPEQYLLRTYHPPFASQPGKNNMAEGMFGSSWGWALVSAARRENPGNEYKSVVESFVESSLETHGQTVVARESLNGRKNMARRKVKNGEKK